MVNISSSNVSSMPLVSVIMPSYNTSRYIKEAIDSVLAQDYPNKELILIDDGSTDGTIDLVRSYRSQLKLITQANQGAAVARNAGLAAAQGEYIAFIDSDDCWLPGKLSLQASYLQAHPDLGVVYSRWQTWKPTPDGSFSMPLIQEVESGSQELDIVPERSGWLYNRLLFGSMLHTITVMARRTLIDQVGQFEPDLKRGQDYDYWLRASRLTEIHQLNRVTALYRLHGSGCVTKYPTINYEEVVLEKALARWGLKGPNGEFTKFADVQKRLAEICFGFGYYHYHDGDPYLAARAFARSVTRKPAGLSGWRYLVMSALKSGACWVAKTLEKSSKKLLRQQRR
ncbi:MAG: glycosyltransferase [Gammaproteobacteria bacterium]|nr:glycosyltransferase [Gammaproteobacteria bacterium]MCP5196494.1 glycosyltransferase [Gammaproteobacteria bacterium]